MELPRLSRRAWLASISASLISAHSGTLAAAQYRRIPLQYIAALAPENAKAGTGAETWGLWREDPGPIGVWLKHYEVLRVNGRAPRGWHFDVDDWWLDENGLIMKAPDFPMPAGQYLVSNGESNVSLLTVEAPDSQGSQRWSLNDNKTIADVTHGPCRSSRYRPESEAASCTPDNASQSAFPLAPGESPPSVNGCQKKDYAVLIVFGVPVNS